MSSAEMVLSVMGACLCFMGWIVPQSPQFSNTLSPHLTKLSSIGYNISALENS
jgi:hypothetical protein